MRKSVAVAGVIAVACGTVAAAVPSAPIPGAIEASTDRPPDGASRHNISWHLFHLYRKNQGLDPVGWYGLVTSGYHTP
jgi:hypothetical protein